MLTRPYAKVATLLFLIVFSIPKCPKTTNGVHKRVRYTLHCSKHQTLYFGQRFSLIFVDVHIRSFVNINKLHVGNIYNDKLQRNKITDK